jgi:ComF family protein
MMADGRVAGCYRCAQDPIQLDGLLFCAFHREPLRTAIHQFKYEGVRALAAPLGRLMSEQWPSLSAGMGAVDAIVPVPLHRRRERERGFNQAALLAREFGPRIGVDVVEGVLVRHRSTAPQVELDAQQRTANVQGAFSTRGALLSGRNVLLIDDVCTSGATLEACCAALIDAGVLSVRAFTLTRPHA